MKLILYIGHHKVGSTALQTFLAQNAHLLAQAGILYPAVDLHGLTHMLRQSIGIIDKSGMLPARLREPHSALAYNMLADAAGHNVPRQFRNMPPLEQMTDTLQAQVTRLSPQAVILCSEVFSNFGAVDVGLIDALLALFPNVSQLQIYCALRRPDEYLGSWHGQRLKVGEPLASLAETVDEYLPTIHFDYSRAVVPWVERCKGAKITLRDYADVVKAGSSVRDFRQQIIVKLPAGLKPPRRINVSMPSAVVEIARLANLELEPETASRLRSFLMKAGSTFDLPPNSQVDMLGSHLRSDLLSRFRPIHAYLNDVGGTDCFFANLEGMAKPPPISQQDATDAALSLMTPNALDGLRDRAACDFIETLRRRRGLA